MAKIDETSRRVRIVGKIGNVVGCGIEVKDIDTDETIDGIFRAIIRLDATSVNTAALSYYDDPVRRQEQIDRAATHTITIANPEIDVTAHEVDKIENDARNEHFAGFAKLLVDEILSDGLDDGYLGFAAERKIQKIIAQRAYDLVAHTIFNMEHIDLDRLGITEHILKIPDMAGWEEITQYLNFENNGE